MPDVQRPSRRTRPLPRELTAALAGQVDELGREWLVALIERAPLERVGTLPLGSFVAVAPRIGESAVAALGDDDALAALDSAEGAALGAEIAAACGAQGAPELSEALDALRDVLWERGLSALDRPVASDVVELTERLARVIDALRSAALAGTHGDQASLAGTHGDGAGLDGTRGGQGASAASTPPPRAPAAATPPPPARSPSPSEAVPPPASEGAPAPFPVRPPNSSGAEDKARLAARLRSVSATSTSSLRRTRPDAAATPPAPPPAPAPGAPAAAEAAGDWTDELEQELERARSDHRRLALLLVELDDAERVIAAAGEEGEAVAGRFAATVRAALRQGDVLALDGDGRAWVIARDSGRVAGRALARRIARAVDHAGELSGEPLQASVGVAVLGEDGQEAEALIDAAEQERFAAAARGVTLLDS